MSTIYLNYFLQIQDFSPQLGHLVFLQSRILAGLRLKTSQCNWAFQIHCQ